jgi:GNAT superfamily N-acetyltransferase
MPEMLPPSEAGLRHWIETHPERSRFRTWIAETGRKIVGFAFARFHWSMSAEGVTWLWAGVHEPARGRGLGARLYETAEAHLLAHGAKKLETFAIAGSAGQAFAEAHGFRETRTETMLRLDPRTADVSDLPGLEARAAADGFRLEPLRALADRPRDLHALYAATAADIPADDPEDDIPYEDWERQDMHDPELSWDGSRVVLHGDRPVALAFLLVNEELGVARNEMTGTLAEYRRRGLARLAKLAAIRWARDNGIRELGTANDGQNAAMQALNERLGYRVAYVRSFLSRPA